MKRNAIYSDFIGLEDIIKQFVRIDFVNCKTVYSVAFNFKQILSVLLTNYS